MPFANNDSTNHHHIWGSIAGIPMYIHFYSGICGAKYGNFHELEIQENIEYTEA
jgi:hypothetical protein